MSGLARLAGASGAISSLALDHRLAFVNAFRRAGVADPTPEEMLATKLRIVSVLGDLASALLLDEPAARAARTTAALVLPLEAQGSRSLDGGRLNELEFTAGANRDAGAAACKLLVHYRADHEPTRGRQQELVAEASEQCRAAGIPLVCEPLVYRLDRDDDPAYDRDRGSLVVEGARDLAPLVQGLMKVEWPGDALCAEVTAACAPLPWVLLGGGDSDGETFAVRLSTACAAGASGFMVGRAVWGAVLGVAPERQEAVLRETALPLFARLREIAEREAVPV